MKFAPEKENLFESSKLKELGQAIKQDDMNDMSVDELLAQIAYQALTEQQLHHIYWSKETQELAELAIKRAKAESSDKATITCAKLARNQAQIIIRDPSNDNFQKATELLHYTLSVFTELDMAREILFTEDELLRTEFKLLERYQKTNYSWQTEKIHFSWLKLLERFENFIYKNPLERDSATIWYRNAVRHFLEFSACCRLPKHGYTIVAIKLFAKNNRKKAIECGLYGLGYFGYQIVARITK